MPLVPFGAYAPDIADFEGQTTKTVLNVVPQGDGYAPVKAPSAFSQAAPAAVRGAFYALNSDGSTSIFIGTSDRLYRMSNTDYSWVPVSKVSTVTITIASPGVVTLTAHGLSANDPVQFIANSDSLPTGLSAGTVYYIKTVLSADTFTLSATAGGTVINTSGTQSGTHKLTYKYSSLASDAQWQFAQFGSNVIAVQKNTAPQVYDLSAGGAFSDLGGGPPQASYVAIVGRFVVLSGLLSYPYRIQWSGLDAITTWTSGVSSSDFQNFPDGGIVRGVAGGEFGIIFQDQAIRRMSFIPGSSIIFQIERISQDKGLFAPLSIVRAGEQIFFYSNQGFQKIAPGGYPEPIGREKVDRTFITDLDRGNLQLCLGVSDPRASRVYWAYKSASGSTGLFDKILGYDYLLDRWFTWSVSGEYFLGVSQSGITLESLDSISSSIDAMTLTLDAYATAVQPELAVFNSSHQLAFFRGDNLEAKIETAEQGTDGQTIYLDGFRPITDASSVYGSVGVRMTQQGSSSYGTETAINSRTGRVDARKSARYMRIRTRIPSATTWTFAAGIEPTVQNDGLN